jgi:NADPH:quinone reductase
MNHSLMRALVLEQYQQPLKFMEIAQPTAKEGQVLVRVKASAVNPLDLKIRENAAAHAKTVLPAILGMDLAGVVEEVGPGVTTLQPGDEVYGLIGGVGGVQGSLAEFAAVDADLLAKKPKNLTMREAAAIPLVFITAWEGLVDHANVHAGQHVLIHGGAGGIGHVAIQLAVSRGASVFATASSQEKMQIIESYGAKAINYVTTSVNEYVDSVTNGEGFDIVYDTVGGQTLDSSFTAARLYRGHVLSALGYGTHNLAPLSFRSATYSGVFTLTPLLTGKGRSHHGEILREATKLAEDGKLKPLLDPREFNLNTVEDAHRIVGAGTSRGKIVVTVAD